MGDLEEVTKLFEDEFKVNILFILDMFGPLNLETIHKLLDKPKSTILSHLKRLIELDQIEVDSKETAKKTGIFYTLTPRVKKLIVREEIILNKNTIEELNIDKGEFIRRIANAERSIGFQANLLSQLTASYLEKNLHLLDDVEKNKEHLMGFFSNVYELSVNSRKDYEEIQEITEIRQIKEKKRKTDSNSVFDRSA